MISATLLREFKIWQFEDDYMGQNPIGDDYMLIVLENESINAEKARVVVTER
jgi:hypothetical protein